VLKGELSHGHGEKLEWIGKTFCKLYIIQLLTLCSYRPDRR
jgi:hypothetical protein